MELLQKYVIGCTIDCVTELGGSFLKVSNPNATAVVVVVGLSPV